MTAHSGKIAKLTEDFGTLKKVVEEAKNYLKALDSNLAQKLTQLKVKEGNLSERDKKLQKEAETYIEKSRTC